MTLHMGCLAEHQGLQSTEIFWKMMSSQWTSWYWQLSWRNKKKRKVSEENLSTSGNVLEVILDILRIFGWLGKSWGELHNGTVLGCCRFFYWSLLGHKGIWVKICPPKQSHSATRTDPVHYQPQEAVFHPTSRHRDAGRKKKTLGRSYALINETFKLALYCCQILLQWWNVAKWNLGYVKLETWLASSL